MVLACRERTTWYCTVKLLRGRTREISGIARHCPTRSVRARLYPFLRQAGFARQAAYLSTAMVLESFTNARLGDEQ